MSDIPAGWQPDPRGRHEYRYWDGTQWTDHVSDQGEVSQDPVADTSPGAAETPIPAADDPAATKMRATPPAASEPEPVVAQPVTPEPVIPAPVETEPVGADPVVEPVATPDPIITPEPVATPEAIVTEPAPTTSTSPASSGPPTSGATATAPSTQQSDAKAAAQDMLHSKSPELATILSAVVPGSGHFYMGTNKVPLAAGLLVATIVALVLSYMNFLLFVVGFVIWLAAAAFALTDLRGGVKGIEDTSLPRSMVGILMIGAGALLVISLFLPYYHLKVSAGGFGSFSGNASGWQSFGIIDIILLIVGVAAIVAGAASLGLGPVTSAELPRQLPLAVAIGGAVATVLILFRMFIDPAPGVPGGSGADIDVGRAFGIWFGLWASLILLIANAGILRSAAANRS
jgi:hypothetical protein